jgi:hypothetical protein
MLQFTSQIIQIKPCGHHGRFFNKKKKKKIKNFGKNGILLKKKKKKKKEFGGCQSNEIQFIKIKRT